LRSDESDQADFENDCEKKKQWNRNSKNNETFSGEKWRVNSRGKKIPRFCNHFFAPMSSNDYEMCFILW